MGADLVIAMMLAAGVTHAWEQGKRRSTAAWTESRRRAEERGAAHERARQIRAQAWADRFATARATGPRDPLWWAYATGWLVAGSIAAASAGMAGVYSGAVAGARDGYRVGRESARKSRSYRETWRQWRTQRDWLDTERCDRCGGYTPTVQIVIVDGYGRVCPDCKPLPKPERDDPTTEFDQDEVMIGRCRWCATEMDAALLDEDGWCATCATWLQSGSGLDCDGTCSNSDLSPDEAEEQGLCGSCGGRREYVSNVGGRHRHTPYQHCRGTGESHKNSPEGEDGTAEPQRIHVNAERVDQQPGGTTKEESTTMAELMPASTSDVAGTGEGYTDTVNTLSTLAKLLGQAHEEVVNLGDMLTANSLDAETLGQINELADMLDTAAPMADKLHKHVESRHAPVADAVAGAGGSPNVATKAWYDQY